MILHSSVAPRPLFPTYSRLLPTAKCTSHGSRPPALGSPTKPNQTLNEEVQDAAPELRQPASHNHVDTRRCALQIKSNQTSSHTATPACRPAKHSRPTPQQAATQRDVGVYWRARLQRPQPHTPNHPPTNQPTTKPQNTSDMCFNTTRPPGYTRHHACIKAHRPLHPPHPSRCTVRRRG